MQGEDLPDDERHAATRARLAALDAVQRADELLGEMDETTRSALPSILSDALQKAKQALGGGECRLARPFADIILVVDQAGTHLECTHDPAHIF